MEKEQYIVASEMRPCVSFSPAVQNKHNEFVEFIFEYWQRVMQHPRAHLDKKRRQLISGALAMGYTQDDLCQAINGCSKTPHNVGENDRGQRYDGLHVILRDADQIDRFIENNRNPPKPSSKEIKRSNQNAEALQIWLSANEQFKNGGKK